MALPAQHRRSPGRAAFLWLALFVALLSGFGSPAVAQAASGHIRVSLLTSTERPRPGQTFLVGLRLTPDPGWHSYWSNPGESGLAPTVDWQAPAALKFGPLQHPAPTLLKVIGITSYVHAGDHVLASRVRVASSVASGTPLPIEARINWLACSESLCVPGRAVLHLELTAGDGAPGSSATILQAAERRLPGSARDGTFTVARGEIALRLPAGLQIDTKKASFFPDQNGVLDVSAARVERVGASSEIAAPTTKPNLAAISGVVSDGRSSYHLRFRKAVPESDSQALAATAPSRSAKAPVERYTEGAVTASRAADGSHDPQVLTGMIAAIFAAVLGGLLLNLMPCVFPVLSLKALALARAGTSIRAARLDAFAYTAGSVLSCATLGIVIMLLRLAGQQVGWSFQLQHPGVTLALALLAMAITLNLADVFEIAGLSFAGAPSKGTSAASSFSAGALTAFVATPCSGPFMATALGATLMFPPIVSLVIYSALGFGLAFPMLLIAFLPRLRSALPRPGKWMIRFQRWMALPTGLAVLALIWLLSRQTNHLGFVEGVALILAVAAALWWIGRGQKRGSQSRWVGLVATSAAIAGLALIWPAPVAVSAKSTSASIQPFSERRLAELRREGVPVFIDITADWCLTCKVNERIAIDRAETRAAFDDAGVVTLRGDWTNGDPTITRYLASHGRNSIPFYLFYGSGRAPDVLPQLLSVGVLRELADASTGQARPREQGAR